MVNDPIQLDRQRAAGSQIFTGSQSTVGNEIIQIDLLLPPMDKQHWIIELASVIAGLTTRVPNVSGGFPPNSGIFLCPPGTNPESAAASIAGIDLSARPFLLPLGPPGSAVATVGAGAFAAGGTWGMVTAPGFKQTVPFGWFLRAIISCLQGTATPGPGAGSTATFSVLAFRESDNEPGAC
jgi:hypothetical protein